MCARNRNRSPLWSKIVRVGWIPLLLFFVAACHRDMYDQPRYEALEPSTFFNDGRSARPAVPETVPVGGVRTDEHFLNGTVDGQVAETFPFPITEQIIERGREQYNINCVPCHGISGYGDGMVWRRGGVPPADFHVDRLRNAPVGHFFNVITNGYRYMYPYGNKVSVEDRWAIIAYIRALQLSQNATIDDVPAEERANLEGIQ